jgi:hypothetical protein
MNTFPTRYINVVDESEHGYELTMASAERFTENYTKPALCRRMVDIDPKLATRAFYDTIDPDKLVQWRRKMSTDPVSMRSASGKTDYNYVTGHVGTGAEFLDDIFEHKIDVYSHLGTISAGYKDPYEWGKLAFNNVREEIFRSNWFRVEGWRMTGHMFFGYSTRAYGEPKKGAVGSDWHMFPTLNVFVMIAGRKKWMTRPPELLEHLIGDELMFSTSSGREAPGYEFDHDAIYLDPGDVLLNPPYEWHKVLNSSGLSLGGAFRVIDTVYLAKLAKRPTILANMPTFGEELPETVAHLLTSLRYASLHLNRAQMMLNDAEHVYPILLRALQMREQPDGEARTVQVAVVK